LQVGLGEASRKEKGEKIERKKIRAAKKVDGAIQKWWKLINKKQNRLKEKEKLVGACRPTERNKFTLINQNYRKKNHANK
jgi:hypothetical protein